MLQRDAAKTMQRSADQELQINAAYECCKFMLQWHRMPANIHSTMIKRKELNQSPFPPPPAAALDLDPAEAAATDPS